MSALDAIKIALNNENKALDTMENYARNNEENYEDTVKRLTLEGYIDGLNYALALMTKEAKGLATAIVKALENKDSETLYGIALELLKDETTTEKAGN